MALQNFTGFETGDFLETSAHVGTVFVQGAVTAGAWSAFALQSNPATTGNGHATFNPLAAAGGESASGSVATSFVRFRFRADTLPASGDEEFFTVLSSKLTLRVNPSGNVAAYDATTTLLATGATALATGTWYRVEVECGTGAGGAAWEVKINGASEISGTGNLGASNATSWRFGKAINRNGNTVNFYFDDVWVDDAAYPGDGRCTILVPAADGTYTTGTPNGAASRWQCVKEVPEDADATYVNGVGNGGAFTSTLGANANISGTVNAAKAHAVAKVDSGTTSSTNTRLRSASTDSDAAFGTNTSTVYNKFAKLYATDPATGSGWTVSGVQAAEVGAKQSAATNVRVTATYLTVDYTPQAAGGGLLARRRRAVA